MAAVSNSLKCPAPAPQTKFEKAVDKTVNNVIKPVHNAAIQVGDSLQKSAKGVVNGNGLVGGGTAGVIHDVATSNTKPVTAVANAVKGAGLGMVGELAFKTAVDLGNKVLNIFKGSK